jgi:hypothetical protein
MRRLIPKQPPGLPDIRLGMQHIPGPKIPMNRLVVLQRRVPGSKPIAKQ